MNLDQILRRLNRQKLDDQITFRINRKLRDFLKHYAEGLGVTESKLINAVLEQFRVEAELSEKKKEVYED